MSINPFALTYAELQALKPCEDELHPSPLFWGTRTLGTAGGSLLPTPELPGCPWIK